MFSIRASRPCRPSSPVWSASSRRRFPRTCCPLLAPPPRARHAVTSSTAQVEPRRSQAGRAVARHDRRALTRQDAAGLLRLLLLFENDRDLLLALCHYLPFTRFRRGFAFLADGLAFRDAAARIAPARSWDTPSFAAIFDCTALNPG